MKITILDDYQHAVKRLNCIKLLENQQVDFVNYTIKNDIDLAGKLAGTNILVLIRERTIINESLLKLLPDLKLISQTGKISNHLDLAACTKYKIAVAEGVGSPIAPAELTWALIMNTIRKIPQAIDGMKNGNWQINIGSTVHGKTIGIWGYGKIGQLIAQYARVFGARVLVWGSQVSRDKAISDGFEQAETKETFFKSADIITLHLRLNQNTFGLVRLEDLLMMKSNAVLINTARAELIEKGALLTFLKAHPSNFAGIDVFENEPIYDRYFEYLGLSNIICTPHLGYVEENGYELYFKKAFENVMNFIKGNPTNIANPEVLNL